MIGYDKMFLVLNILMHKKFCTLLFRIHGGHDNEVVIMESMMLTNVWVENNEFHPRTGAGAALDQQHSR